MMNKKYYSLLLILLLVSCGNPKISTPTDIDTNTINLEEGTNFSAAVSPDGSKIVFDALGRLWVRPYQNGESMPITDKFGNARQPRWHPNGEQIVFQAYWEGNWHIYTVRYDGSSLRQITSGVFDHREPEWSPDGKKIICSSDRGGNYDLWTWDLESEEMLQVTYGNTNEFAPSYSTDGTKIVFVSDDPNEPGIKVKDLANHESTTIYTSEDKLHAPAFSPLDDHIYFNGIDSGGSNLLKINLKNNEITKLFRELSDVFPFRVSWIGEDEYLFTANGKLFQKKLNENSATQVPINYQVKIKSNNYWQKKRNFNAEKKLPIKGLSQLRLAPNAESALVVMLGDIWQLAKTGEKKQITDDDYVEISPVWSPDGTKIAYVSDRSGTFAIWTKDMITDQEESVADVVGSVSGIDWSSSNKIAVSSTFGPRLGRIIVIDVASKKVTATSAMINSSIGAPSWNGQGNKLAVSGLSPYSSLYREGVNQVLYFDENAQPAGRLDGALHMSLGVRGSDGPLWSPDGNHIASISSASLVILPIDPQGKLTGEPKSIYEGLADNPSWSADSKHVLFIAGDKLQLLDIASGRIEQFGSDLTWDRVAPSGKKIIHAGWMWDGKSEVLEQDVDVHISGNRIEKIVPHQDGRIEDITYIDASQQFVMPGLIDGHAHQGSWEGRKLDLAWLSWGVTSTRDPATNPYDALNRREARESGHTLGPRIFFTGAPFDGNRIYYSGASALQSKNQIDLELQRADLLDYDMIKTYVRLSDPLQKYIIDKAHDIGIPVSSHELYPASAMGIDGIEHISGTSRRGYSAKLSSQNIAYSDVTTLIAKSGITFTPTTGIYIAFNYLLSLDASPLQDSRVVKFVDPGSLSRIQGGINQIKSQPKKSKMQFENALKMVADVHRKGGLITAGTDGPIIPFGFALHMELESYQKAGLSNFEVLKTCTSNAAKLLHAEKDLGTLETGKLADILILNKNPLEDIRNTRSMHGLMINGEFFLLEDILEDMLQH